MVQGDRIVVPGLSDAETQGLPEFQQSEQFTEVGEDQSAEFRTM